jgi:choline dehydrogenase-like flavoprotein
MKVGCTAEPSACPTTPQLLLLSGVGPADELRRHGISVVHELKGVGKNLQDHLDCIICYSSKETDLFGLTPGGCTK